MGGRADNDHVGLWCARGVCGGVDCVWGVVLLQVLKVFLTSQTCVVLPSTESTASAGGSSSIPCSGGGGVPPVHCVEDCHVEVHAAVVHRCVSCKQTAALVLLGGG